MYYYDKNYLLPRNQFCLWSLSIENVLRPLEIILIYKDMGNGLFIFITAPFKDFSRGCYRNSFVFGSNFPWNNYI